MTGVPTMNLAVFRRKRPSSRCRSRGENGELSYPRVTNRSSVLTVAPVETAMAFTVPSTGAETSISIFIASRTMSTSPAFTDCPTLHSTLKIEPGMGLFTRGLSSAHRDGSGGRSRLSRPGPERATGAAAGAGAGAAAGATGAAGAATGAGRSGAHIGDTERIGRHSRLLSDGSHHHGHQLALIHRRGGRGRGGSRRRPA